MFDLAGHRSGWRASRLGRGAKCDLPVPSKTSPHTLPSLPQNAALGIEPFEAYVPEGVVGGRGTEPPHPPTGRSVGHQRGGHDPQPIDPITPEGESAFDSPREGKGCGPGVPSQQGSPWERTSKRQSELSRHDRVEFGRIPAPHIVGMEECDGRATPSRGFSDDWRGFFPGSRAHPVCHEGNTALSQELSLPKDFNLFNRPGRTPRRRSPRSTPPTRARRPPPTGSLLKVLPALFVVGLMLGGFTSLGARGTPGGAIGHQGETAPSHLAMAFNGESLIWFNETGLPLGTSWSVLLGGLSNSSNTSSIGFVEPQGHYAYTIGPVSGYTTPDYSGSVNVNGPSTAVPVPWTLSMYPVVFQRPGSPQGPPGPSPSTAPRAVPRAPPSPSPPPTAPIPSAWDRSPATRPAPRAARSASTAPRPLRPSPGPRRPTR
jgi:hypothetical protein